MGTQVSRLPDCRPLLADADDLTLVFQPVVDLATAEVAGYEALARFPGVAGPDVWFAAAADAGIAAELGALAVAKALDAVDRLPPDTFLAVHVDPRLLGAGVLQRALSGRADLRRVVIELSGQFPVDDPAPLRRWTDALRERGALLCLADTESGCPGLQQMAALRPDLVKLGRSLVAGLDGDPVRTALAETVGGFAGRIGARVLAQGVETTAELGALARLGVSLGQGWLLGRPSPDFLPPAPEVARLVHAQAARARSADTVAGLVRPVRQCSLDEEVPGVPPAVLTGPDGGPAALLLSDPRTAEVHTSPVLLRVSPSAGIEQTLYRALGRPPAHRFEPVVCTDSSGRVLGLLRVEDLASAVGGHRRPPFRPSPQRVATSSAGPAVHRAGNGAGPSVPARRTPRWPAAGATWQRSPRNGLPVGPPPGGST